MEGTYLGVSEDLVGVIEGHTHLPLEPFHHQHIPLLYLHPLLRLHHPRSRATVQSGGEVRGLRGLEGLRGLGVGGL